MIAIRDEIRKIKLGQWPRDNNPLKHAPHTAAILSAVLTTSTATVTCLSVVFP